jgi:hypothetical protein
MKYVASLFLLSVFAIEARADVASRYHMSVSADYGISESDEISAERAAVDAYFYPRGVRLKPGSLSYRIDQINGTSHLRASVERTQVSQDETEIERKITSIGGEIVFSNRRLFLGFDLNNRSIDSTTEGFEFIDKGSYSLTAGLRSGRLLTRLIWLQQSEERRIYLGTSQVQFTPLENDLFGVEHQKLNGTGVDLSWVDRTSSGNIYSLNLDVIREQLSNTAEIQTYSTDIVFESTYYDTPSRLLSTTEVSNDVDRAYGVGVRGSYFISSDLVISSGWTQPARQSPYMSGSLATLLSHRFILNGSLMFGSDIQAVAIRTGVRF